MKGGPASESWPFLAFYPEHIKFPCKFLGRSSHWDKAKGHLETVHEKEIFTQPRGILGSSRRRTKSHLTQELPNFFFSFVFIILLLG